MAEKAVVLLSGGTDSTTTLAIARSENHRVYALSFRYGQRHHAEIQSAQDIAKRMQVEAHLILEVDLSAIGGSALTGRLAVPKKRTAEEISRGIPVTYVPARNIIFLSYAVAWAEVLGAADIYIGVNAVDYSGYPDCRPEFIRSFEATANLATKAGVEGKRFIIHAPLMKLTKAEIIRKGMELGVDFSLTRSCYDPDPAGRACGECDSCLIRKKGFREAGVPDPTVYQ
jgi:7-cyano-7-deazaguanine synthase